NDSERMPVQGDLVTDNCRIGAQFFPELVTEDDNRMAIRRRILFRQKCSSESRFYLEQIEVISGYEQTANIQSVAAAGHPHSRKRVGRHRTKRRVLFGVVLEVQIRGRLVALDVIVGGKDLYHF